MLTMYFDRSAGSSEAHSIPNRMESSRPLNPPADRGWPAAESPVLVPCATPAASSSVEAVHAATTEVPPFLLLLRTDVVHAAWPALWLGVHHISLLFLHHPATTTLATLQQLYRNESSAKLMLLSSKTATLPVDRGEPTREGR